MPFPEHGEAAFFRGRMVENDVKQLELGFYLVTGAYPALGRSHLDIVRAGLAAGADVIQLREKDAGADRLLSIALEARALLDNSGGECLLIINDMVDVAIASRADGVHVGRDDTGARETRAACGPSMLLGVSASTLGEAKRAEDEGADYLGVGPIFETPSKADAAPPMGIQGLRLISEAVSIPIVAIGGINEDNAESVLEAGADGVAVISAVCTAADMEDSGRRLRRLVDSHKGR
jgi:thiamine-phosphate pyrophosphorylase